MNEFNFQSITVMITNLGNRVLSIQTHIVELVLAIVIVDILKTQKLC